MKKAYETKNEDETKKDGSGLDSAHWAARHRVTNRQGVKLVTTTVALDTLMTRLHL